MVDHMKPSLRPKSAQVFSHSLSEEQKFEAHHEVSFKMGDNLLLHIFQCNITPIKNKSYRRGKNV